MVKRVVCVLACAGLVACAAAMQASRKSPGKIENGEFKPARPPTENYGVDKTLSCPEGGVFGGLIEEINQKNPKVRPEPDGRLCAIADTLLGWKDKDLPPDALRQFLSRYFGLPGTISGRMLISDVESEDTRVLAQSVVDPVMNFAASAQVPRYGLQTERVKKNLTHIIVVFYDENIDIQPLPKKASGTVTLQGTLTGELTKPRIEVVDPIGHFKKTDSQDPKAFKADLNCGDRTGKLLVQVVADKEGSDTLVTNFPVWCNGPQPMAVKMATASGPVDPADAEKQLLDLVNSDRKEAGLKPLNALPALSNIARDIAQKQADGKGVTAADLNSALKQAEIAAPMLLESMARGFGTDDLYARFSDSPSDRANTMNPDVTDVGVGVVKGPMAGDKQTYIAAQLFIKQRPPVDPVATKEKLYKAIEKKRADARAEAPVHDKTLDDIAQQYAEAAAASAGRPSKEKESEIMAPLYKESMTVNQLGGFVPDENSVLDVAEQPAITGSNKLFGVGVAIGNSPQFGKGSPFVMVLTGTRHDTKKGAAKAGGKKGTTKKSTAPPPPPPPPKKH